MDHQTTSTAYGLWGLVFLNSAIFIAFAFSFFKPHTTTDWRTFGAFSGFIVALFVEMYGFPLTLYLLSGWLAARYPGVDFLSHDSGHLLHTLLRIKGDPHFDIFHILSNVFILGGFLILSYAWQTLWQAQRRHQLACTGLYAWMRHPQYVGFILIMFGFLLQWPKNGKRRPNLATIIGAGPASPRDFSRVSSGAMRILGPTCLAVRELTPRAGH